MIGVVLALLATVWLAGLGTDLLNRLLGDGAFRPDASEARTGIVAEVPRRVLLTYREPDGRLARVMVGEERLSAFVRRELSQLEAARSAALERATHRLHSETGVVFEDMHARIARFADWYYAWGTSYRLAGEGLASALGHALRPGLGSVRERVARDLQRYVQARYRAIVLRPARSDPALHVAFEAALLDLHVAFRASARRFDEAFRAFVAEHTTHLEGPPEPSAVVLTLDWSAATGGLSVAGFERGSLEAARGIGLTALGAVAGRTAGSLAARHLALRLAGPHVTRGITVATGAAAGAAGGAAGLLAGATIALGVDWALNEGVETMERPGLEARLAGLVAGNEQHWHEVMEASLAQTAEAWYGDLGELLTRW